MNRAPVVDGAACANARHAATACRRCVDACPTAALTPTRGGAPVLDPAGCVGCGACVPVCPLRAISDGCSPRPLHQAIADLPPGPVVVVCDRRRAADAGHGGHLVAHRACLASLGPGDLLDLAERSHRHVVVDDTGCARCEIGQAVAGVIAAVDEAGRLARAYHRPQSVQLASRDAAPGVDGAWRDARGGAMSRRGMFRRLAAALPDGTGRGSAIGARLQLIGLLRTWEAEGSRPVAVEGPVAGFTRAAVDGASCLGCGLCADVCPTDALAHEVSTVDGARRFELRFRPARCVGCGVCAAACRERSLSLTPAFSSRSSAPDAVEVVAAGVLHGCEVCGSPCPAGAPRCFSCIDAVVRADRDEPGLMADLLARIPGETP